MVVHKSKNPIPSALMKVTAERKHKLTILRTNKAIEDKKVQGIMKLTESAKDSMLKHEFTSTVFSTIRKNKVKAMLGIMNPPTNPNPEKRKDYSLEQISELCKQKELNPSETELVKSFVKVYWPIFFFGEPDLCESALQTVKYLKKESISKFNKNHWCSFGLSVNEKDGTPAGYISGAIFDINKFFKMAGIETKLKGDPLVAFVGYVAVGEKSANKNVPTVLLSLFGEQAKKIAGKGVDFYIAQIDPPEELANAVTTAVNVLARAERKLARAELEGDLVKIEKAKNRVEDRKQELEDAKVRESLANARSRLWSMNYEVGVVKGSKAVEAIPDGEYPDVLKAIKKSTYWPLPSEQPPLNYIFRDTSGQKIMEYDVHEALVKLIYVYYGITPKAVIAGTSTPALPLYMGHTLGAVEKQQFLTLEKPPYREQTEQKQTEQVQK